MAAPLQGLATIHLLKRQVSTQMPTFHMHLTWRPCSKATSHPPTPLLAPTSTAAMAQVGTCPPCKKWTCKPVACVHLARDQHADLWLWAHCCTRLAQKAEKRQAHMQKRMEGPTPASGPVFIASEAEWLPPFYQKSFAAPCCLLQHGNLR